MSGWIKIHRRLLDHWCAEDPMFLAVWTRLLLEANYKPRKALINGVPVQVDRGQLIYGREAFSRRSGVPVNKLRRIITVLENEQLIHQQKTNKFTLISITKYDEYQLDHQQSTSTEPSEHHQTTTPEEVKEGKEGEEREYNGTGVPDCPHDDIINLYHEHCPTMPAVKVWNEKRRKQLRARWREDAKRQSLEWWAKFFRYCDQSDFLRGDKTDFTADLEWLTNANNIAKIIEGKYENKEKA